MREIDIYKSICGADYEIKAVYNDPDKEMNKKAVKNILFLSLIAPIFLAPSIIFKTATNLIKDLFDCKPVRLCENLKISGVQLFKGYYIIIKMYVVAICRLIISPVSLVKAILEDKKQEKAILEDEKRGIPCKSMI